MPPASCYRRLPLLRSVRARNAFVRILDEVREQYGFAVVGYVIMPEHVHLLISEPRIGTPSTVMQVLKQRVSRKLRRRKRRTLPGQLALPFGQPAASLPHPEASGLAATLPRFQRVEREEEERKAGVHALESGQARAGGASERLAVGQCAGLRGANLAVAPDRLRVVTGT